MMYTSVPVVQPLKYLKIRFILPISKYREGKVYQLPEVRAMKYVIGHYAVIEDE